jgi:hypothetical protein
MRRILIVSLFLVATSAHAEHIWRAWCGTPLKPREVSFDTSAECQDEAAKQRAYVSKNCVETKSGPVFKDGSDPGGLPNCEAVRRFMNSCTCRAEAIETQTDRPDRSPPSGK